MSKDFDQFWQKVVRKYRRKKGFTPSADELRVEANSETHQPLSEDEIDSIVAAVSGSKESTADFGTAPELSWLHDVDTSSVEDGVLQLNRNRGETQDEVEERLKELRRKALEENRDDEDDVETT